MNTAIPSLLAFLDCFTPLARRVTWASTWVVAVICPGFVGAACRIISCTWELVPWAIRTPPGVGSVAATPPMVSAEIPVRAVSVMSEAAAAVKIVVFMSIP